MSFRPKLAVLAVSLVVSLHAQGPANRYALVLSDPAPATETTSRTALRAAAANLDTKHRALRQSLSTRGIAVTGSANTLLNAVFIAATPEQAAAASTLPGVTAVVRLRRYKRNLNRATQLLNGPTAWNLLGGPQNGGAGIKIAILDSGVDQSHPAFQDPGLTLPAGYPLCTPGDCIYTNNKVIVARSYVRQIAAGTGANPAADSRPDDYSARDRDGHGTAVASCAAAVATTGDVPITGMAPKAYLGNYKIYGSPQVNDTTSDDIIIQALEDAIKDGMDIISFSSGGPAFTGPLDTGATCGNPAGVACDLSAMAFENAAKQGVIIVAAAGNEGEDGNNYPAFGTVGSPANAPSVIAAGATTNSHTFVETLALGDLKNIPVQTGDSSVPPGRWSFPLVDVTALGNDGFACAALPAGSLAGKIALVQRGPAVNGCTFTTKMNNAVDAGALGVVFYMLDAAAPISPSGVSGYGLPAGMVSLADGQAIKTYIAANPGKPLAFVPGAVEQSATPNLLAGFSSIGPSIGDAAIKPDLVAVGSRIYMAGQRYDPLGSLYSADGFTVADGTSFATPLTSGAAALVKQKHPDFTAAQVKSALVNTAINDVTTDDSGAAVGIRQLGGGRLDAAAAVNATVTASPATLSFGAIRTGGLPKSIAIQVKNHGAASLTLTGTAGTTVTLSPATLTLAPAATATITATLSGAVPAPGSYSGTVLLQAPGVTLRFPFLYVVPTGTPSNLIPLSGNSFVGTVGQPIPDGAVAFRLVDGAGLPVANVPVTFSQRGGGTIQSADRVTDAFGIAGATAVLGAQPGSYSFTAVAGNLRYTFSGYARSAPVLQTGAVVNGASFEAAAPIAPGSYATIFGINLSDFTDYPIPGAALPMAVDYVNVSFDVPSAGLSVPARFTFVGPGQLNIQVPWELQGYASAQVKVTIDSTVGNLITVPIADSAPAFFETAANTVAALDTRFRVINAANAAVRGQTVQLYANGLGPVTNPPATGEPALASPLSLTRATPQVTIGGQDAPVTFSGLAPGFPGLYQVNVVVPAALSAGSHPITVAIGGRTSKVSGITVQ